mmetsp:Transcript_1475/g.3393  ORF Transcript_1475/g.3393 Transcript_1475/m.3393 type:complete len:228 (-) Transcript_1475:288-971(-)
MSQQQCQRRASASANAAALAVACLVLASGVPSAHGACSSCGACLYSMGFNSEPDCTPSPPPSPPPPPPALIWAPITANWQGKYEPSASLRWGGVSGLRAYSVVTPAGAKSVGSGVYPTNTVKFTYPTVELSGANIADGTYAMHAGGGNSNGVAGCDTYCRNLGLTKNAYWDVPLGSGYPAGINDVVGPSSVTCLYRSSSPAGATSYVGYSQAATCGNPMFDCVCDTS